MEQTAPNRCLYIKVAKLRTGLIEVFVKIKKKLFRGGGGVGLGGRVEGGGGQAGCERRIEVFVKI